MATSDQALLQHEDGHLATDRPASYVRIQADWWTVAFVAVFLFAAFLRFSHLDYMALHHDESLYAFYTWQMYTGGPYEYDPLQHGPFQFHYTTFIMFLFGDSDASVRLGHSLLGLGILLMVWALRHNKEFGLKAAVFGVALIGLTPISTYFNRFFRHDTPFAFHAMAIPLCYVMYRASKRNYWLHLMAAAFALMFCTKENAFVTVIVYVGFATLYLAERIYSSGKGLDSAMEVIQEHPFLTKWLVFVCTWGMFIVVFAALHVADTGILSTDQPQAVTPAGKIFFSAMHLFFIVLALACAYLGDLASKVEDDDEKILGLPLSFFRDGITFAVSFFIFGIICVLLYTNFFRAPAGEFNLIRSLDSGIFRGSGQWFIYWYHQHSIARIKGPYLYYVPQLLLYESLTFGIFLFAVSWRLTKRKVLGISVAAYTVVAVILNFVFQSMTPGVGLRGFIETTFLKVNENLFLLPDLFLAVGGFIFGAWFVLTLIEEKQPFKAFVYSWAILALLIYSYLQEKVPWLALHIVIPMHLCAAMALRDLWDSAIAKPIKAVGWATVALLGGLVIHSTFEVVWYNSDNAVEQLVYVQTHKDMKRITDEIHYVARYLGMGDQLPIGVAGDASFPMRWYLREYKKVSWSISGQNRPVMISNWSDKDRFEKMLPDYVGRRYQLRSWWIPSTQEWLNAMFNAPARAFVASAKSSLGMDLTEADRTAQQEVKGFLGYLFFRERWNPQPHPQMDRYGSVDVAFWVHKDLYDTHVWEMYTDENQPGYRESQGWKAPESRARPVELARPPVEAQPVANIREVSSAPSMAFGAPGQALGQFNEPKGIATDELGNIYVADTANHRVQKFNANGEAVAAWGSQGEGENQYNNPTGLVYQAGSLYVADTWNHRIKVLDPNTGAVKFTFGDPSVFWAPKELYYDQQTDSLFVVVTGSHLIRQFNLQGQELAMFGGHSEEPVPGLFFEPVGMATDAQGNVYIADTAHKRIQKLSKQGVHIGDWPVDGFENFYTEPFLAIDRRNRLYVSDTSTNRILVYSPSGQPIAEWGSAGNIPFIAPKDIHFASDGRVFVSDAGANQVYVFNAPPL